MTSKRSETHWLNLLKTGDEDGVAHLWESYCQRLLGLARKKLAVGPRRIADEEDVALSAFHSFCRGAAANKFVRLEDRDDLWQVLAMLTTRKAIRQLQRERSQKRGGGEVRGESVFDTGDDSDQHVGIQDAMSGGPTPEFTAMVDEEFELLLDRLADDTLRTIALAKLEGYSNAEIAEQLGRHERTVERKIQLIRKHWNNE